MNLRAPRLVFSGALLALLAAGCSPEKNANEGIKVGFYGSLSGATATFGISGKNGATLAIEEINSAGGVLGGRLVLISEDDRGESAEAASAVSKLIARDHVSGLLGEAASSRTLAAAPIAQKNETPMITPSSTNPQVTRVGNYIFRVCFTDDFQGEAAARFALATLKAKTASLLVDIKSDYSVGLAQAFRQTFEKGGGRILSEQRYSEGDTDFSAQLTQMRASPADVLFVPGYYTDVGLVARQKGSLGVAGVLLGGDGWDSPRLVEIGGEAMNGAYFCNHYSPQDPAPAVQSFVSAYRKRFGDVPDSVAALAYDAARLLADAIRRAGATSGPRVRDALASTKDFPGVAGNLTLDLERNPIKPITVLKIENGKYRFVERVAAAAR
jgi:branched-chain amino acid transport system substrate-binding protein